jgi:ribosomal protein S18 acetylase RimI-like enzyme
MTQLNPIISLSETTPSQYKDFSCGEPALDEYLTRYAKNHEKINIARTFVLLSDESKAIGYYTLSAAQLNIKDLPEIYRARLPKYPVPASRLCRLAVDQLFQGKRIGEHLLADAIKQVLKVDATLAIHSLIVDAKNSKAKNFYQKYGFLPLDSCDLTLFLPLSTLKKSTS